MTSKIYIEGVGWIYSYPQHKKELSEMTKLMSYQQLVKVLDFLVLCISELVSGVQVADKKGLDYIKRDKMYEINMHVINVARVERMMEKTQ